MNFRSHNFKTKVYKIRNDSNNTNIKIRPSLTERRQNLLQEAIDSFSEVLFCHFVFSDCNGNIKIRTNKKIKNKQYFNIRNRKDIADLVMLLDDNVDDNNEIFPIIDNVDADVYDDAFCEIMRSNNQTANLK